MTFGFKKYISSHLLSDFLTIENTVVFSSPRFEGKSESRATKHIHDKSL